MPFGGRITSNNNVPTLAVIPGPPAAALAVVGGFSRGSGGAAKPHDSFSWAATLAEARGELLTNGHYQTKVTSSISKVWARNNPHIFEAGLLRVTLVSDHASQSKASIRLTEAVFGGPEGMRLDGDPIEVETNNDLSNNPTMDAFEDKYQTDRAFFTRNQTSLLSASVSFGDPMPRTSGGYAMTSIVQRVKWRNKTYNGNVLQLSGFGTLYFGEVLMNDNNRRLTMVRLRMGSALGAEVAYAEADPNGTWGT